MEPARVSTGMLVNRPSLRAIKFSIMIRMPEDVLIVFVDQHAVGFE